MDGRIKRHTSIAKRLRTFEVRFHNKISNINSIDLSLKLKKEELNSLLKVYNTPIERKGLLLGGEK